MRTQLNEARDWMVRHFWPKEGLPPLRQGTCNHCGYDRQLIHSRSCVLCGADAYGYGPAESYIDVMALNLMDGRQIQMQEARSAV